MLQSLLLAQLLLLLLRSQLLDQSLLLERVYDGLNDQDVAAAKMD